ncbi:hypothetical protein NIES22_51040 [Calothrix brevissima NIES-22]|nr:hypothetical protein NIES22_51040 [Calothrix brevissima NIES-22]
MLNIQLQESILAQQPQADKSILTELMQLVDKYNLKWVPSDKGTGAYFVMSQLSEAKGLGSDDYKDNWANLTGSVGRDLVKPLDGEVNLTRSVQKLPVKSLHGRASKLEGERLKKFKDKYFQVTGESLGRINSLWVGDWFHAYSYLVQGRSEASKDFQILGATAIKQGADKELGITQVDKQIIYRSGWSSEEALQRDISYLSSMTPYTLKSERSFPDFPQSKTTVRRFDLIHLQPHKTKGRVITCYELKKNVIDYYDLVDSVEAKRYPEVLKTYFDTQHVKLILVAPFGGTAEALDKCQQYDDVEIWNVRKLTLFLLEKAKAYHKNDPYFVNSTLVNEYETVKKLLTLPNTQSSNILPMQSRKAIAS